MAKKRAEKRAGKQTASVAKSSSPAENEIKGASAESRRPAMKAAPSGLWSRIRRVLGR